MDVRGRAPHSEYPSATAVWAEHASMMLSLGTEGLGKSPQIPSDLGQEPPRFSVLSDKLIL